MKMTNKQKLFCDEYLIDLNATQASIRAGYSPKTAYKIGNENLRKPQIKKYIDDRLKEKESKLIANQTEVLQYLTSVMRGESLSEVVVIEGEGKGFSSARTMMKNPDEKERLKAGELLGKYYGLTVDKVEGSLDLGVTIIKDDIPDEDE